jgi:hypothetical protein
MPDLRRACPVLRRVAAAAAAVCAAALAGCTTDPVTPSTPGRVNVAVTADADSLFRGDTSTVTAQFPPAADSTPGHVLEATWSSSDTTVAVVEGRGLRSGAATAVVSARGGGGRATLTVRVRTRAGGVGEASTTVTTRGGYRLGVWPDTNALLPGLTRTLVARDLSVPAPGAPLAGAAWSSDAPGVVAVDGSGRVTALAPGRATVTAILGERRAAAVVVVRDVGAPLRFTAVVAGVSAGLEWSPTFACGLADDGRVFCWGSNQLSLLGSTAVMDRCERVYTRVYGREWVTATARYRCSGAPVEVDGGRRFTRLSATQEHACGVTTAGDVYCWGLNRHGQVGAGDATVGAAVAAPARADAAVRFREVSAGPAATCALTDAGAAHCWGLNPPVPLAGPPGVLVGDESGLLGVGSRDRVVARPRPVAGLPALASVSVGDGHACGLTPDGEAWCWGHNYAGQLGDGAAFAPCAGAADTACYASAVRPRRVAGGVRFRELRAGRLSTCGIAAAGGLWCWGLVGVGEREPFFTQSEARVSRVPVRVEAGAALVALAGAPQGGVAFGPPGGLDAAGALFGPRGWNDAPRRLLPDHAFAQVASLGTPAPSSGQFACGLGRDGLARCWLPTADGARGDGSLGAPDVDAPPSVVAGQR